MWEINSLNTSGYMGVTKKRDKWQARINKKSLGVYNSPEEAGAVYIEARKIEADKVKSYIRELGYNEDIVSRIK